jgi:hypothetical protein
MCIDKLSSHVIRNVQQQAWEIGNKGILMSQPKLWFETNILTVKEFMLKQVQCLTNGEGGDKTHPTKGGKCENQVDAFINLNYNS